MSAFPTIRSGVVSMYPLADAAEYRTGVVEFCDASEQRWAERDAALARFTLTLSHIDGYDLAQVIDFWRSAKGAFDTTWSITIEAGRTFTGMAFDSDELQWTESKPERYTLAIKVRQV